MPWGGPKDSGVSGDPTKATAEIGRMGIEFKVNAGDQPVQAAEEPAAAARRPHPPPVPAARHRRSRASHHSPQGGGRAEGAPPARHLPSAAGIAILCRVPMATHFHRITALCLFVTAGAACRSASPVSGAAPATPSSPAAGSPGLIQPGAPGQARRSVSVAEATDLSKVQFTPADVKFMQGMIGHHAQALEMVALLPTAQPAATT